MKKSRVIALRLTDRELDEVIASIAWAPKGVVYNKEKLLDKFKLVRG